LARQQQQQRVSLRQQQAWQLLHCRWQQLSWLRQQQQLA
jgi:hypothetical protein